MSNPAVEEAVFRDRPDSSRVRSRWLDGLLVAAVLIVLAGAALAPERTWPSVLLVAMYLIGLSLAGLLFLAFHYVTSAAWSVVLKRVAEAMASTLPAAAVVLLFSFGGLGVMYEWSHAEAVAANPLLQEKSFWLNVPFFLVRAVLFVGIWLLFMLAMLRTSRRQDRTGGLEANRASTRLGAGFIVAFAVTFSLASFDWLMSLQPEWYSTMVGVYNFAGLFTSGLAVIAITTIVLRRNGVLAGVVTKYHLHDLGKLILGFSTFWVYIWFCQYMLIWYGNLPEEVTYFQWRHSGPWAVLAAASVAINWAIPFLVLLPRPAKHNDSTLLRVSVLLVVGHWLDLYLTIQPVFEKEAPVLGLWEIAPVVGGAALFVVFLRRGLAAAALVPHKDPYLAESLEVRS